MNLYYKTKNVDEATTAYHCCPQDFKGVELLFNPEKREGRGAWESQYLFDNGSDVVFQMKQLIRERFRANINLATYLEKRQYMVQLSKDARSKKLSKQPK
jgi:hypothetical protein